MVLPGRRRIHLEAWYTFAEISGSAAAALTGLLFVAVSIRRLGATRWADMARHELRATGA